MGFRLGYKGGKGNPMVIFKIEGLEVHPLLRLIHITGKGNFFVFTENPVPVSGAVDTSGTGKSKGKKEKGNSF
jgi:hypothetical protein